jgi:FkbM family methyltransferase
MYRTVQKFLEKQEYKRYSSGALHPRFSRDELTQDGYVSQYGQDKWVAEVLLPGKRNGIFADIGAHDGISLSNTFFLENQLDWTGVGVEPMPHAAEKFRAARACQLVQGCVAETPGKRQFTVVPDADMRSGLKAKHGAQIEVKCHTLNELFDGHGLRHVDYLSIDVEGSELEILRSIDFSKVSINIIGVESNHYDRRIFDLLSKNGYSFHSRLGTDEFYIR